MRKRLAILACFLLAALVPAHAYWQSRSQQSIVSASSYVGPGDIVSGAIVWYSCSWGYNAADTANACNVCLPADTVCADITLSSGVAVVPASLSTCSLVTICTVKTMYDKGSLGNNITNATEANRPTFRPAVASNGCPTTSNPCLKFTAANSQQLVSVSTVATVAQPLTFPMVYNKTASGNAGFISTPAAGGGNAWQIWANSNNIIASYGSNYVGTISNNAFHAMQVIVNSTSSLAYADGASLGTGDAGSTGSTSKSLRVGVSKDDLIFMDGYIGEIGYWSSAFNGTQQSNMNTNMKTTRWGF